MTKETYTISVKGVHKDFGKTKVLKGIDLKVRRGTILALLGPNGAGKTTTIRILSTLLKPDKGRLSVAGFDVLKQGDKVRASIGLTGQFAAVDEYLTGRENVKLIGQLYHMNKNDIAERTEELLQTFDLIDAADRPAKTYSGGMKRRLDLAMSLVASPPILFLDEPTTGLDPRSRMALWGMIKNLARAGTTILLTTQYMEEADHLADNVIVIDHGTVIAEGTVNELKAKAGAERVEVVLHSSASSAKIAALAQPDLTYNEDNNTITMPAKEGVKTLTSLLTKLGKSNLAVETASLRRPTLDDVFLALTGHASTEEAHETEVKK